VPNGPNPISQSTVRVKRPKKTLGGTYSERQNATDRIPKPSTSRASEWPLDSGLMTLIAVIIYPRGEKKTPSLSSTLLVFLKIVAF
jgi:hypothetical protein